MGPTSATISRPNGASSGDHTHPDLGQVRLLPGTYRIPEPARPLLRAALIDHQTRGLPAYALFAGARGGGLLLTQAMGNLMAAPPHSPCRRCPVESDCLGWALAHGPMCGVWAGTTEAERRAPLVVPRLPFVNR